MPMSIERVTLLSSVTTTATGSAVRMPGAPGSVQAVVSGTGAVTATVVVEVSNDGANWQTLDTITLSGTTNAVGSMAYAAPFVEVRGRVSAISGTGAAVTAVIVA